MAESRESQHSILPSEEDLVTAKPQRSWNPLGGRSSPSLECAYLPPVFTHESFSEEVYREVELRITDSSGTLPARGKRDSVSSAGSETTTTTTPGFLKTPRATPAISPFTSLTSRLPHSSNSPTKSILVNLGNHLRSGVLCDGLLGNLSRHRNSKAKMEQC